MINILRSEQIEILFNSKAPTVKVTTSGLDRRIHYVDSILGIPLKSTLVARIRRQTSFLILVVCTSVEKPFFVFENVAAKSMD